LEPYYVAPEACLTGHPCSIWMNCWILLKLTQNLILFFTRSLELHYYISKQIHSFCLKKPVNICINQS